MIRKAPTKPSGPMNKAEATAITDRIRQGIDAVWNDLLQAYERKAWKALGYSTWEAYVNAEFSMSRQHSYRLLDQGRVIREIGHAVGENVTHGRQITERDARDIKDDLPAVTGEIKAKVDAGEDPEKAVAETVAAKRTEKENAKAEKATQQAEWDRQREEAAAALPQGIKDREQAKVEWRARADAGKAAEHLQDRVAELEENVRVLEAEAEELRAENKLYREMKVQFEQGGFEKVVADKDELIRTQGTRIEAESRDKALWMNKAKFWKDEAIKLGWKSGDFTVDIETGEIIDV